MPLRVCRVKERLGFCGAMFDIGGPNLGLQEGF